MPDSAPTSEPSRIGILFRYGAGEHPTFLAGLTRMAELLVEQGAEVHHIGCKSPHPAPPELHAVCRVHELPLHVDRKKEFDKFWKAFWWLMALPWIGWWARRKRFDLLFIDETVPLSVFMLRLTWRGPLVMTVHDFFIDIYMEPRPFWRPWGRLVKAIDLWSWKSLDGITARVNATRTFLQSRGIDPHRVHVIHDACDLDLFKPGEALQTRAQWGIPEDRIVLVHHGVMHPNKGNDRIIDAFATYRDRLADVHLLLVGGGAQLAELRRMVTEHHLEDQVTFTDWLPAMEDVVDCLRAGDIGLAMRIGQPADHFHVTSTMVHNLACGLPVLAAELSGFHEVMDDGVEGYFFDHEKPETFVQQLRRLADDPDLRERMGRASRVRAERDLNEEGLASAFSAVLLTCVGKAHTESS